MKKFCITMAAAGFLASISLGQIGYSVNSNTDSHLYRIDFSTGIATDLGALSFIDAEGISFGPSGQLFAIGGTASELWNITSPPGSLVGGTGTRSGLDAGMDFYNGVMYNIQGSSTFSELYTINLATGASTSVGTGQFFGDNIAISSAGIGYVSDWIFSDSLYTINLATGGMTLVGGLGLGDVSVQAGSDFSAAGTLYNLTSDGQMWTIDTATGLATFAFQVKNAAGANLTGFEGLAIETLDSNPVPEPGTMALMGLGALAVYRKRKKSK